MNSSPLPTPGARTAAPAQPQAAAQTSSSTQLPIVFIGGGNMAGALIGGLLRQGHAPSAITVIEPFEATRSQLGAVHGVTTAPDALAATAVAALQHAALLVWAVKPQVLKAAVQPVVARLPATALHLSVVAGIRSDSIAGWLHTDRVVRAMPNTPALVGRGITGLFARAGVTEADRACVEQVLAPTGQTLWMDSEPQLDVVTALSGSGPAYVFYFIEAMTEAGVAMGLPETQARRLAIATFDGAAALAAQSDESAATLRARVTSKGGTTHAAISSMESADMKRHFIRAMEAARTRAGELGDEFGAA